MYNIIMIKFVVSQNDENRRLDKFLKSYLRNASLSHIYKLLRKDVKVNGKRAKHDAVLVAGDELTLYISEEDEKALRGGREAPKLKRQFKIAYEDKELLVVEKPFGLLTHGTADERKKTLANQVLSYLMEKGDYDVAERAFSPSPVNRLDRNTTGLVIFGKTGNALKCFNSMIRERASIRKYYLTIVKGTLQGDLKLRGKLEKDCEENRVTIGNSGKEIETIVKLIDEAGGFSLVEAELVTGRTHQIRAHLSHAGYPVIGDAKYGDGALNRKLGTKYGLTTQLLHAERLYFEKMTNGYEYLNGLEIKAALPAEFSKIKDGLFFGGMCDDRN